jgi:protein-arginine kinase activator protein McsA
MKNTLTFTFDGKISEACARCYEKIATKVDDIKSKVLAQFKEHFGEHEHLLRLALNEAEALAWQTQYPQLVFQDLAEEKARDVVGWITHQRLVNSLAPA